MLHKRLMLQSTVSDDDRKAITKWFCNQNSRNGVNIFSTMRGLIPPSVGRNRVNTERSVFISTFLRRSKIKSRKVV